MIDTPRITELDYHPDTAARFAVLADRPWSVFLDSGRPRTEQGRYDVYSAEPFLTLTTRGVRTEIRQRDSVEVSERDPLQLLKHCLGESCLRPPGPPFVGGAIGYFAYDLGRRFEKIPQRSVRDIAMPDMAVGLYDWAVVVDHVDQRAWIAGLGRDERTFDEWDTLIERAQPVMHAECGRPFDALSSVSSNFDRDSYEVAFREIKRYIRMGDCYQVNLTQRFSAPVSGDSWLAYLYLREINPAPFSAYLRVPEGTVLSSSPERFLRVRQGLVETKPIKGTRPRSKDPVRDNALVAELCSSEKDRAENVMIVDLLRNDLGRTCIPGSIEVPRLCEVESFASVHHLVSTVTGRLGNDKHAIDLLTGCFPGGSITGAPKVRAMEIIEELEPHRRSVYCGSVGYIGFDGDMDSNIAIRTLVKHDDRAYAWAGGGVVADSEPQAEYQESLDKAAALLALLSDRAPTLSSPDIS